MVSIPLVLSLAVRTAEFVFYHLLLSLVDRVSGPTARHDGAGGDAPVSGEHRPQGPTRGTRATFRQGGDQTRRVSLGIRAAQVPAYLLTRGDEPFQRYFLSAPRTTIMRWAIRFRSLRRRTLSEGRPPLDDTIVELIVTLKRENPVWGRRRIREDLA